MKRLSLAAGLIAVLPGLVACAGGGSGTLDRNPRAGQFYTNEEIVRLPAGERNAYCAEMEDYLAELKAEAAVYNGRIDSLVVIADTLRTKTIEVSAEIREVNGELRELRLKRKSLDHYETREGDTLRSIAKLLFGDPLRWEEIYEANKAKVADPDGALPTGTVLTLPQGGQ